MEMFIDELFEARPKQGLMFLTLVVHTDYGDGVIDRYFLTAGFNFNP